MGEMYKKIQCQMRHVATSSFHTDFSLASRTAGFEECFLLVDNVIDGLCQQVEEKIDQLSITNGNQFEAQDTTQASSSFAHVVGLKKRQTRQSGSKRKKNWLDKYHKNNQQRSEKNNPCKQTNEVCQLLNQQI